MVRYETSLPALLDIRSLENRTKNERDSKLEGIAWFNMESTSTLVNMVLILGRVLVKVLGGGQVL